ncbi:MAG: signal peptide peptidase SppA [Desulfohalobium sp.]
MENNTPNFSQRHPFVFGFMLIVAAVALLVGAMAVFSYWSGPGGWGQPKLGVVHVRGMLTDARPITRWIETLEQKSSVQGVLVRIDSPGGVVAPSQEIFSAIQSLAAKKPVVVSMGSVAASGGYYAAVGAPTLFANPGTITGSIGVKAQLTNFQGLLHKLGIEDETVVSGPLKDATSASKPMTEAERTYMQNMVDDMHEQFVQAIVEGRDMEEEVVRRLADGRAYTGQQAKELGLVDALGSMHDALKFLRQEAEVGSEYALVEGPEREMSLLQWLLSTVGIEWPGTGGGQAHWEFWYE